MKLLTDYNAAFVGACAGLYHYYGEGHEPIPNFPHKKKELMTTTVCPLKGKLSQVHKLY